MDTNKGKGWKVLLSLGIVALMTVGPYYLMKRIGGGSQEEAAAAVEETVPLVRSQAFRVEPMEGIVISAGENELDRDREFTFREATAAEWMVAEKAVAVDGAEPFFVMDIDAGLKPDEMLPGMYDVAIDLKELGVPENLWDRVGVFRVVSENQRYRYHSYVDRDGVLHYSSNQNTLGCLALTAAGAWWLFKWYVVGKFIGAVAERLVQNDVRTYFEDPSDYMGVPWEDENGNFLVHFRWRDMGGGKEAMEQHLALESAIFARLDAIKVEADEEYERRIDAMATGRADLSWWEKWKNREARDQAREVLLKESVFEEYMQRDSQLKALKADPLSELPEPVLKIIDIITTANAYLSGPAGLRPLPYQINVFMMNATEMSNPGENKKVPMGECYIKVGFEAGMEDGKWSEAPKRGQSVLLTLTHELFHARQQSVYALWHMGMNAAESTAAVLEADAARWYYRNGGRVSVDIDTKEGNAAIELTPRTKYYIYARPMDRMFATDRLNLEDFTCFDNLKTKAGSEWAELGAETGYTLASLIETVRETAGKQNVGMVRFCENYIEGGDFSKLIKKSLGIDDAMLEKGWNAFVKKYLGTIVQAQTGLQQNDGLGVQTDCYQTDFEFIESLPIQKIRVGKLTEMANQQYREWHNYYLKSWYLKTLRNYGKVFNVFVQPVSGTVNPHIRFYLKNKQFENGKEEPSLYCDQKGNKFLAMSVGDYDVPVDENEQDYWVVALFAPDAPEIKGLKENAVKVKLPEQMSVDLKREKLISGAVLTYQSSSGREMKREITPEEFGKVIEWEIQGVGKKDNDFTLSVHWYYQPDKETTYVSPESEKVFRGTIPVEEEAIIPGEIPGETEGPAYDGPEKRPELTVRSASIKLQPFALWHDKPKGAGIPSGCGAWGVEVGFDASKGEITVSYLGNGRWDIRCHTSGGDYAEGVEGSSYTTAAMWFVYEMAKGHNVYQQGFVGTMEHIDGSFSLTRKKFIKVGREWYDHKESRWKQLRGTDIVNAAASFKDLKGWSPYGKSSEFCADKPESFSFSNNYNRAVDNALLPGLLSLDMSDVDAYYAEIARQKEQGVAVVTQPVVTISMDFTLEKNGYTGE